MKKTLLSTLTITFFGIGVNAQNVNIPDANFKAYLVGNTAINTNLDAEIQVTEANSYSGSMDASSLNISDMTGIEAFTSLPFLLCNANLLTSLDVSQNLALTVLSCNFNSITSLDVSNNTSLYNLSCSGNPLTTLDVTNLTALTTLHCNNNQLSTLDLSNNPLLDYLSCFQNPGITSLDLSNNPALDYLDCDQNNLTTLDLSNNTVLYELHCNANQITSINFGTNIVIEIIECGGNLITNLDVSNFSGLIKLMCAPNQLTSLDCSNNPSLWFLSCSSNALTNLNVKSGGNTTLTSFYASSNPDLTCIQVDDAAYSTTNWTNIDVTASFSVDCSGGAGISEISDQEISIYPNPATSELTINTGTQIKEITIFDMFGSLVQKEITSNFSIENLANGVYIVNIKTSEGFIQRRFIKQ